MCAEAAAKTAARTWWQEASAAARLQAPTPHPTPNPNPNPSPNLNPNPNPNPNPSPNPNPNPEPDQALCEWPVPFHLLPLVDIAQLLQHRGLDWGPKASALLGPLAAAVD